MTLSFSDDTITIAFTQLEGKISELEDRLKYIGNNTLYPNLKRETLAQFEETLTSFEDQLQQLKSTESVSLKKSLLSIDNYNKKCKILLDECQEFLGKKYPNQLLAINQEQRQRSSNTQNLQDENIFMKTEEPEKLHGDYDSPIERFQFNSNFSIQNGCESDPNLSPSLLKLIKHNSISKNVEGVGSDGLYSDVNTPPMNSGAAFFATTPGKLEESKDETQDTPKLENIGLSSRSYAFFKSLLSPSSKETPEGESISDKLSLRSLAKKLSLSKYFYSSDQENKVNTEKSNYTSFDEYMKSPLTNSTIPAASSLKNVAYNVRTKNQTVIHSEDDSIYADAELDNDMMSNSDYEFKFCVNI